MAQWADYDLLDPLAQRFEAVAGACVKVHVYEGRLFMKVTGLPRLVFVGIEWQMRNISWTTVYRWGAEDECRCPAEDPAHAFLTIGVLLWKARMAGAGL